VDEGARDNLVVESAKISNGDVLIDEAQSIIHEMKMRCWTWIIFYFFLNKRRVEETPYPIRNRLNIK
jgi:hypothetical protein